MLATLSLIFIDMCVDEIAILWYNREQTRTRSASVCNYYITEVNIMFIHNSGRFYIGNFSFALPNGVLYDAKNSEVTNRGFFVRALDDSFTIQVDLQDNPEGAEQTILFYLKEIESYKPIGEKETIMLGELPGCKIRFENKKLLHEEYAFDISGNKFGTILDILVAIKKDAIDYKEEEKDRVLNEILGNFRFGESYEDSQK